MTCLRKVLLSLVSSLRLAFKASGLVLSLWNLPLRPSVALPEDGEKGGRISTFSLFSTPKQPSFPMHSPMSICSRVWSQWLASVVVAVHTKRKDPGRHYSFWRPFQKGKRLHALWLCQTESLETWRLILLPETRRGRQPKRVENRKCGFVKEQLDLVGTYFLYFCTFTNYGLSRFSGHMAGPLSNDAKERGPASCTDVLALYLYGYARIRVHAFGNGLRLPPFRHLFTYSSLSF